MKSYWVAIFYSCAIWGEFFALWSIDFPLTTWSQFEWQLFSVCPNFFQISQWTYVRACKSKSVWNNICNSMKCRMELQASKWNLIDSISRWSNICLVKHFGLLLIFESLIEVYLSPYEAFFDLYLNTVFLKQAHHRT